MTPERSQRLAIVDPSLFTLPFDVHFARGLAAEAGGTPLLVGRPLRAYETLTDEPFDFQALFYRLSEGEGTGWKSSKALRFLKGAEHALGYLRLARLVAASRIDIVHLQWLMLPLLDQIFLRRLRRRARLFLTVHNSELTAHSVASLVGRLGAPLQAAGQATLLGLFDGFFAHTEKTVLHLKHLGIAKERILLLPHPPLLLTPGAAAEATETSTTDPVDILFFGSIKPYKGVDLLVEAALELARTRRDFRVRIAGRPFEDLRPLRASIEAASAEEIFAFDLDYVPDERLDAYLRRADLVVFPYREVDGSGALALAASYGKAIVASRVGVFAEPPVSDHIALVEPDDVLALARALERFVGDVEARRGLAERGATLSAKLGDWQAYARACLDFYGTSVSSERVARIREVS